jgi:hypothetical protein
MRSLVFVSLGLLGNTKLKIGGEYFVAEFSAYLTIRFEGPEVRPGRMRLDDFIQAARDFSACAKAGSDGPPAEPEHRQRAAT